MLTPDELSPGVAASTGTSPAPVVETKPEIQPPTPPKEEKKETRGRHPNNCNCASCTSKRAKAAAPASTKPPQPGETAELISRTDKVTVQKKLKDLEIKNAQLEDQNKSLSQGKKDLEEKINATRKINSPSRPGKTWLDDLQDFWDGLLF